MRQQHQSIIYFMRIPKRCIKTKNEIAYWECFARFIYSLQDAMKCSKKNKNISYNASLEIKNNELALWYYIVQFF